MGWPEAAPETKGGFSCILLSLTAISWCMALLSNSISPFGALAAEWARCDLEETSWHKVELSVERKRLLLASFVRCRRKRKRSVSPCVDPYGSLGWWATDNDKMPSVKRLFWKKTGAAGGFHYTAVGKWHIWHIKGPKRVCRQMWP